MMEINTAKCVVCGGKELKVVDKQTQDYEYFVKPMRDLKIVYCKKCDSEFIYPRPTVEELISFYPLNYHTYNDDHGMIAGPLVRMRARVRARNFVRLIEPRPIRLFDVGTGDCRHFEHMKEFGDDFQFAGVEIKPEMVEAASKRGYQVQQGTLEEMDITSHKGAYDVVTMYQLVEHVLGPRMLFVKAFSLLKPGGYVLGQLPCRDSFERKIFGRYWSGYHYPRHIQMLSRQGLFGIIESAGFSEISIKSALHLIAGQSLQNFLVGKLGYRPKMTYGKVPIYSFILLCIAPFCLFEHLLGKGGMINFMARKPVD